MKELIKSILWFFYVVLIKLPFELAVYVVENQVVKFKQLKNEKPPYSPAGFLGAYKKGIEQ